MQDLVPILILVTFFGFLAVERLRPARSFPKTRRWLGKGMLFFVLSVGLSAMLPMLWLAWAQAHRLLNTAWLGTVGGGVIGFLLSDFLLYLVHRAQHRFTPLWRMTHQMHHSAERVDVAGAFYFHPLDIALTTAVSTLVPFYLLGVTDDAAALSGYISFFYAVFQHANIKTPAWLGWVIQRPEAHCIHHQRGVHAYNYGNFPAWDILFGTYRNPEAWTGEAGFYEGASRRVGAMLVGKDVAYPIQSSSGAV